MYKILILNLINFTYKLKVILNGEQYFFHFCRNLPFKFLSMAKYFKYHAKRKRYYKYSFLLSTALPHVDDLIVFLHC